MQTRAISCETSIGQPASSESCKKSLGAPPLNVQACEMPVCVTYACDTGQWGACSLSCAATGGERGTKSRTVLCRGSDGSTRSAAECPASCLAVSTLTECTVPECRRCNYRPNAWLPCSVSCGSGTRSRSLDCICNDGLAGPPAECDALGAWKPEQKESCFEQACPTLAPTPNPTSVPTPAPTNARPGIARPLPCSSNRSLCCLSVPNCTS